MNHQNNKNNHKNNHHKTSIDDGGASASVSFGVSTLTSRFKSLSTNDVDNKTFVDTNATTTNNTPAMTSMSSTTATSDVVDFKSSRPTTTATTIPSTSHSSPTTSTGKQKKYNDDDNQYLILCLFGLMRDFGLNPLDNSMEQLAILAGLKKQDRLEICPECGHPGEYMDTKQHNRVSVFDKPAVPYSCMNKHYWWPFTHKPITELEKKYYCIRYPPSAPCYEYLGFENCVRACVTIVTDYLSDEKNHYIATTTAAAHLYHPLLLLIARGHTTLIEALRGLPNTYDWSKIRRSALGIALMWNGLPVALVKKMIKNARKAEIESKTELTHNVQDEISYLMMKDYFRNKQDDEKEEEVEEEEEEEDVEDDGETEDIYEKDNEDEETEDDVDEDEEEEEEEEEDDETNKSAAAA
jgi:hypothetical protein